MNFEWDESKSEGCFTQRGFDFAYAAMRIISARKANQREVKHYEDSTQGD